MAIAQHEAVLARQEPEEIRDAELPSADLGVVELDQDLRARAQRRAVAQEDSASAPSTSETSV